MSVKHIVIDNPASKNAIEVVASLEEAIYAHGKTTTVALLESGRIHVHWDKDNSETDLELYVTKSVSRYPVPRSRSNGRCFETLKGTTGTQKTMAVSKALSLLESGEAITV
jgi:hypothetical protein